MRLRAVHATERILWPILKSCPEIEYLPLETGKGLRRWVDPSLVQIQELNTSWSPTAADGSLGIEGHPPALSHSSQPSKPSVATELSKGEGASCG